MPLSERSSTVSSMAAREPSRTGLSVRLARTTARPASIRLVALYTTFPGPANGHPDIYGADGVTAVAVCKQV